MKRDALSSLLALCPLKALTTGHHCTQNTHCWLIVTRWTQTARHNVFIGCMWRFSHPAPTPTRAPELSLHGASGRWGLRLDRKVICAGTMRRRLRRGGQSGYVCGQ